MYPHHLFDLYQLLRSQWRPPEEIKRLQNKKLKKLIRHAYEKVPYYRDLFESLKIKPEYIQKVEDLPILPVTSKKELQALPLSKRVAENIDLNRCKSYYTSGTTGIPLNIYYDPRDMTLMNLNWVRAFLAAGMKPWYKMVDFRGMKNLNRRKAWYEYLWLFRRKEISAWSKPREWIEEIQKWGPQVIVGYVKTLRMLAEAIQEHQINDIRPKIVFHSSVVLDDFSRQILLSVFRAKRVDIYGSYEGGCIAWECEKCSAYHLCSDMVIVEILKDGKPVTPGEDGEVVITNLHSYAMPFIRYKQEDVVTLSPKTPVCGRGLPLLDSIQGKTDDFITLKSGRKISPQPFFYLMEPIPGIKRWRTIQESIDKLRVEIEPSSSFTKDAEKMIDAGLKRVVGDEMEIEISLVDTIKVDPSTKFRFVYSKVKPKF